MLKYHKNIIKWKLEKYNSTPLFYNKFQIVLLMENAKTHLVSLFKDYLLLDDNSEFLKEYYYKEQIYPRLKIIYDYYELSSYLFPNYTVITEGKYIYKNILKKQKLIDYLEDLEEKKLEQDQNELFKSTQEKQNNNDNSKNCSNIEVFDTKVYENIITETANDSKIKELFCVCEKKENNDSLSSLIKLTEEIHCKTEGNENNPVKIYVSRNLNKSKVNKTYLNINIKNINDCKTDKKIKNAYTNLNPTIFSNNNKRKLKNNKSKEILTNIAKNFKNNYINDSQSKSSTKTNRKKYVSTKKIKNKIIINYNNKNINNCYIKNNINNKNTNSINKKINGNDYHIKSVSIIDNISKKKKSITDRNYTLKNNKSIKKECHSKILSMCIPNNINFIKNTTKKLNKPLKSNSNDKNIKNDSTNKDILTPRDAPAKENLRKLLVIKKDLFNFSKKKKINCHNKSISRQILKNINLTNSDKHKKKTSLFNNKKMQICKTRRNNVNSTQANSYNFSGVELPAENINSLMSFKINKNQNPSVVYTFNNFDISSTKSSKEKKKINDVDCNKTKRFSSRESEKIFRKKLQHIKNKKSAIINSIVMSITSKKKINKFNTSTNFINLSGNNGKNMNKTSNSHKKKMYSIQLINPNNKNKENYNM